LGPGAATEADDPRVVAQAIRVEESARWFGDATCWSRRSLR